ncbi:Uncharacterized peptidase y4nA [Durusdinium trenchii]|uniref:Prolyl endopeptidase n=1 Tax=Durusdinium trenchii TaxID=1381693 RepID=A0ABP0N5Y7_9DINO
MRLMQVVLDLDELCRAEGRALSSRRAQSLTAAPVCHVKGRKVTWLAVQEPPERAMLLLSRGGQDAFVAREFDLTRRAFVEEAEGGFVVPEGKSVVSFCSRDVLLVSGDFGPGTLTNAGYPRCVRVWRRGTRLTSSPLLFEGDAHDHVVFGYVPSKALQVVQRSLNFHAAEWYLREGDGLERPLQKLLVPQDAELSIFKDLLVLHLRSDFQHFPQGAVLVQGAAKALAGGEWQLLWAPERDQHQRSSTLRKLVATRSFLVLQILDLTLQGQLLVFQHDEATQQWRQHWSSSGDDSLVSLSVRAVSCRSDGLWLGRAGFRQPPALFYAEDIAQWKDGNWHWLFEGGGARLVRRLPQLYEAAPVEEMRLEARSADGTLVPFTCLRPRNCGEAPPTLVYAYGGFGIPLLPNYNASIGAAWLERGGQYIEANLRGGGEFGPAWERAGRGALGRLKVYEDLEAVADELVARGLAAPGDLALMGRSNGGLLVANALVREVRGARGARRFRAFVAEVPLTDMRHYHTWLAGHSWLEEYGDPEQKWEELRQISAYHLAQELQARESEDPRALRVLFTTSTRDDRVHPCHARKMVKLLQSLQLPNLQTFLYESQEGGHGGAASIGERALLRTLEYEFLWQSLTS